MTNRLLQVMLVGSGHNNQPCRLQGRTILIHGACHVQKLLHRIQPFLNLLHAPEAYMLGLGGTGVVGRQLQTVAEAASTGWRTERPKYQRQQQVWRCLLELILSPMNEALHVRFRPQAPTSPFRDHRVGLTGAAQLLTLT